MHVPASANPKGQHQLSAIVAAFITATDELNYLHQRLTLLSQREGLLTRIDEASRSLTQPDEITLTAATILGRYLDVNRCAYADVESDQDTFNLVGNYTNGVHSIVGRYMFNQFSLECLRSMRAGLPFVVEDSETDRRITDDAPSVLESFRTTAIRSVICVPVMKRGTFSAAMAVHCNYVRHWHQEEISLVLSVANRCWESIERTRVLRDLQASQSRLQLAQEAGKIGVFDWYIQENQIHWSKELEKLYGVPPGAFEGGFEHWLKRIHPEDARRVGTEITTCVARRQRDYGYDFRAILPDGKERWLHGQAHFFYSSTGEAIRMIGINADIHERRLAEDALIRTEKLAAVGRLAASIAHEINNPLESVTNLLYLARHSDDLTELRQYLDTADTELRRVSLIANQTLRFHRQSSKPTKVTAQSLFDGVLAIYQGKLINSNIEIEQRPHAPKEILCFEGEIRQVFTNLIGNAMDAMPSGGKIFLRSREIVHANGQVGLLLTVADTGSGMSAETRKKLFEPFFTTKGFNGTGLGLWVSQEIVARHRGSLRLRSKLGKGTVFTLFLPFEAATR